MDTGIACRGYLIHAIDETTISSAVPGRCEGTIAGIFLNGFSSQHNCMQKKVTMGGSAKGEVKSRREKPPTQPRPRDPGPLIA